MKRPTILIADCHEEILIALQKLLEDAGFETTTVWTAKAFVEAIQSCAFDLVIINEYMPGGPCEELLDKVREQQLPCILMRPRMPSSADRVASGAFGACEVVCKHDHAEIVQMVLKHLGGEEKLSVA